MNDDDVTAAGSEESHHVERRSWREVDASEAHDAPLPETVISQDEMATTVLNEPIPGAEAKGTPWYRKRAVLISAGAGLVAIVGASIAVAVTLRDDVVAAPSPSVTESPSASPSPSAAPLTLLDDGIAEDEYPALAESHGSSYPEAYVMEDWVWDKAGPGWVLGSVADQFAGRSAIYLVSPEGALFELFGPQTFGSQVTIASWLEESQQARVNVWLSDDQASIDTSGGLLDLKSGELELMSFKLSGAESYSEEFIAASPGDQELWWARPSDWSDRVIATWSPSTGWNTQVFGNDVNEWARAISPDSTHVAFEYVDTFASTRASQNSGDIGKPNFALFDLAAGTYRVVKPVYSNDYDWCGLFGMAEDYVPIVQCSVYGDSTEYAYGLARDGQQLELVTREDVPLNVVPEGSSVIQDRESGVKFTYLDYAVVQATVEVDGEEVVLVKAGESVDFGGVMEGRPQQLTDGITLLSGANACAILDTRYGHGVVLFESSGWRTVSCVPWIAAP